MPTATTTDPADLEFAGLLDARRAYLEPPLAWNRASLQRLEAGDDGEIIIGQSRDESIAEYRRLVDGITRELRLIGQVQKGLAAVS